MKYEIVTVDLGQRSYDILIGGGMLARAGDLISQHLQSNRVVIISDENVKQAGHVDTLEAALTTANISYDTIILPAGEATKSFSQLDKLLNNLLALKPDRKLTLLALGGGVIGDITGFAASILLRGVPFIQIPTTLLAMVDSSVGGKTGINTSYGKNLIGSFYQPQMVLVDIDTLRSLPKRELLAGYAEVVKYGLIGDAEFFSQLEECQDISCDMLGITEIIQICCALKAKIVSEDEKEGGIRALLNLGHTFAHALEAEMGYDGRLLHGEAVSVGMVLAFAYSCRLGLCSQNDVKRVEQHLMAVGLPITIADIDPNLKAADLLEHMYQDKKTESGKLVFILATIIGDAIIRKDIDSGDMVNFLNEMV